MDALFDSINIPDLLSTSDISDPTSPLSAPDLRLLITRLESHSLHIKSKVRNYLLSHRSDFSSLFSLCNDAVSQADRIDGTLSDLLLSVSEAPIDAEIREIVSEMSGKMREAKVKRGLLGLLGEIVGIIHRLRGVRDAVKNGRLRIAAEEVRDLKKALRIDDDEEDATEPVVFGMLRKEWLDCFEEIQEVLVRFMENAVRFDPDSGTVEVKYQLSVDQISGVDLRTILEAMEVVGILDYGFAKVADQMIKFVFTPAVNCGSLISFVEDVENVSEELTMAVLNIMPSHDHKMGKMDAVTLYSGILQVIKFIYRGICFQNGTWVRCFGRLTWPRLSELIITNFLSKAVPEDAMKLADFQKIIKHTSEFENSIKEMMFISSADNMDLKLSNFTENVEVHFASRKKTEILAKARNLLLHCDFSIPQEYMRKDPVPLKDRNSVNSYKYVVNLLFLSERCVVSETASQLMELIHQTLKVVCLSSPRVALQFYHAARDVILLYEAVIPVKLERLLNGINQVAVLMHNDCLYLSKEIFGLAFQYRPYFPSPIKENAVFVDMAPRFQLMAEEILQRQIEIVILNLKEAIDGADGFQNTHQMQQYESAKFSIDQVIFILEKVRIIWEPLLLPSTYKKSMCTVLESVFSRILRDILLLDDMAADETLQLQRLINLMLESLSPLMESLIAVIHGQNSDEYLRHPDNDLIPSLSKIRKLAELLDMPLKSITTAWESGELHRFGFTISEVEEFIKAIFADSPLRKECLWRIANVSL
ncbi:hypothetical protein K2173_018853 [Erythroxylum novogranatense]|uniref:Centromere/kinetochore protein zw10 homolog n=1 Tax=Erythroxylum novogranatense TaxID=1862640 RepID=A0AAV8SB43_9ROSI|nr:hypothetical protein K2173_018853 [Erythroxylum novogranatense]